MPSIRIEEPTIGGAIKGGFFSLNNTSSKYASQIPKMFYNIFSILYHSKIL
jgi:hypothetical protein